jgi:hypothetical protein
MNDIKIGRKKTKWVYTSESIWNYKKILIYTNSSDMGEFLPFIRGLGGPRIFIDLGIAALV